MAISRLLIVGLVLINTVGIAQTNRYMVFFKDKAGSSFSVSNPLDFLSQKALDRRIRQGISVTEMDFPVNGSYVQNVKSTGADTYFTTRWMNGVLVQCDQSLKSSIEALPFVDRVEFVAPQARLMSNGRRGMTLRRKAGTIGVETETQLQMIGVPQMHADDFRGEGVTIAVFDGGFQGVNQSAPFEHIFDEERFNDSASFDFVRNSGNVFQYDDHGTNVLSVISAYVPDAYTGAAYEANFQLYVTEDVASEFRIEEYNWLFAAERADSAGVDIINSSLGYYDLDLPEMQYTKPQMDGKTAIVTQAAQFVADRGVLVVCSAGNEGNVASWRIITAPADAVDVIAVGNVNANGAVSSSSSRGPTADNRIKPDLSALGSGVRVVTPSGTISSASGTSLASPLVAGLAAGVWQRYPDLTNKGLIEVLKRSASHAKNPNNDIGYGIPGYDAVVKYMTRLEQPNIFEVFPNPVADTVKIRAFNPEVISSCRVEIVASNGQIVADSDVSFNWSNDVYTADLSTLPPGLYFIRVLTGDQRFVHKVIKN